MMKSMKRTLAFFLALIMAFTVLAPAIPSRAEETREEEDFEKLGKIRVFNAYTGEKKEVTAVLKKEGAKKEIFISAPVAGTLAQVVTSGTKVEGFYFSNEQYFLVKLDEAGSYWDMSSNKNGKIRGIIYENEPYYHLEEILTLLRAQFYEVDLTLEDGTQEGTLVYLPPQVNLLDLLEDLMPKIDANDITQDEMALNSDGTLDRVLVGVADSFAYSANNFSWQIFTPWSANYLDNTAAEQALMQLSYSDETLYEPLAGSVSSKSGPSLWNQLGENFSAIGDISDGASLIAAGIPTAIDAIDKFRDMIGLVNFTDDFDLEGVLGEFDSNLKVAGYLGDAGALLSAIGDVNEAAKRGVEWSSNYADQLRFLSNFNGSASVYGYGLDNINSQAKSLLRSYNAPVLAGSVQALYSAMDFGGDKGLAAIPIIGPVYSLCKAGLAVAKSFPTLKQVLEQYDLMYTGLFMIEIQAVARGEAYRLYQECKDRAASGLLTQKDLNELRSMLMLWLRCQMRAAEMASSVMKVLGKDKNFLLQMELRMEDAASYFTKIVRTEEFDKDLLFQAQPENFLSDKMGQYRQEITEKVWFPGGSVNNGTRFVYDGTYTYFWKDSAGIYHDAGGLTGYFGPEEYPYGEIVKVNAQGEMTVIYAGNGTGNLGVSGSKVYFNNENNVYYVDTATNETSFIRMGTIIGGDDDRGYLVATTGNVTYAINMSTAEVVEFTDDHFTQVGLIYNGYIFYTSGSQSEVTLYMLSMETGEAAAVASFTYYDMYGETPFNSWMEIPQVQAGGDEVFFTVGAYGGTGAIYAGGYLMAIDLSDMSVTTVLGSGNYSTSVGDRFRLQDKAKDGHVDTIYIDGPSDTQYVYLTPCVFDRYTKEKTVVSSGAYGDLGKIIVDGFTLCTYEFTEEGRIDLVTADDYETYGVSALDRQEEKMVRVFAAQRCGDFVYFTLQYSYHLPSYDLGWRYWFQRDKDVVYRKDLVSGETVILHTY